MDDSDPPKLDRTMSRRLGSANDPWKDVRLACLLLSIDSAAKMHKQTRGHRAMLAEGAWTGTPKQMSSAPVPNA
jgi:hypothetical protein